MFRVRGCFDLQADDGSGTALLLTALITSLNDINATNIHVNAMRIMTYTASASTTPRGRLLAMDRLGE